MNLLQHKGAISVLLPGIIYAGGKHPLIRLFLKFSAIAVFLLVLSSCKKNKDDIDPEDLPEFNTCIPASPSGHLIAEGLHGPFTFTTNGGGTITINLSLSISFGLKEYDGFFVDLWGSTTAGQTISGNHENMNGKHVKDRIGNRRTIVFPDGAKITMIADGNKGPLQSITIYDGAECHHINAACGTLEYSSSNQAISKALDEQEADGETGTFEFTSGGLLFVNIYKEDTPGNKIAERVPIAEIYRADPAHVDDYYN